MSQEQVNCNQCGATLTISRATNFVTCGSCDTSLTVHRTGFSTFTELTQKPTEITPEPVRESAPAPNVERASGRRDELSELQRQNEVNRLENQLNRLDFEWEKEKEQYMITRRYGYGRDGYGYGERYLPTKGGAVGGGIGLTAFGILWTIIAFAITSGFSSGPFEDSGSPFGIVSVVFPLFGVVFIFMGIVSSVMAYNKAEKYEQARRRYENRRSELMDKIEEAQWR